MSRTIVAEVEIYYGRETARAVRNFFNAAALPVPRDEEYRRTYSGGSIVFLDDYGLLIRLTPDDEYPLIEHPHVLQPLLSCRAGALRIGIVPGIRVTGDEKMAKRIRHALKKDNVNFWDDAARNIGRLPLTPRADRKSYVIIDEDACRKLNEDVASVKKSLGENSPQEKLYGPLRDLLRQVWPDNAEKSNPAKMNEFWNAARRMKAEGKLAVDWRQTDGRWSGNAVTGALYARRLRAQAYPAPIRPMVRLAQRLNLM